MDLSARMLADPWKLAEMQTKLFWITWLSGSPTMQRMLGNDALPVAEPAKGDNRFREADWQDHSCSTTSSSPTHRGAHTARCVSSVEGLPEKRRRR